MATDTDTPNPSNPNAATPKAPPSALAPGGLADVVVAMLAAARSECSCRPCEILRTMADRLSDALLAEKPAKPKAP